jgi:hypothetical protein
LSGKPFDLEISMTLFIVILVLVSFSLVVFAAAGSARVQPLLLAAPGGSPQ